MPQKNSLWERHDETILVVLFMIYMELHITNDYGTMHRVQSGHCCVRCQVIFLVRGWQWAEIVSENQCVYINI